MGRFFFLALLMVCLQRFRSTDQLEKASTIEPHDEIFGNERYLSHILSLATSFEDTSVSSVPATTFAYSATTTPRTDLFPDSYYTYGQDQKVIGSTNLNADLYGSSTWFGWENVDTRIPFGDHSVPANDRAVEMASGAVVNYVSPLQAQCEASRSISNDVPATFTYEDGFNAMVPAYNTSQTRFANTQIGPQTSNASIIPSALMDVSLITGMVSEAAIDSGHGSSQIMKDTSGSFETDSLHRPAGSSVSG